MTAYYNEIDDNAAKWLRNLIAAGHIPAGDVDTRSITEVTPYDLRGYAQCHFFAGLGGWAYALRLAGWPDDRPVWTGSCPCQPYSTAGRQRGQKDERHLWPVWFGLIRESRPATVFGEQVANAITHGWLDEVYADLEAEGYAVGSAVLPACSVGAPHKRDRLWFVGISDSAGSLTGRSAVSPARQGHTSDTASWERNGPMANAGRGRFGRAGEREIQQQGRTEAECSSAVADSNQQLLDGSGNTRPGWRNESPDGSDVGNSFQSGLEGLSRHVQGGNQPGRLATYPNGPVTEADSFGDIEWLPCPDGKARPVKPGIRLLAHGVSGRVGRLRAYGNAIVPQVAAEFIKASMG